MNGAIYKPCDTVASTGSGTYAAPTAVDPRPGRGTAATVVPQQVAAPSQRTAPAPKATAPRKRQ